MTKRSGGSSRNKQSRLGKWVTFLATSVIAFLFLIGIFHAQKVPLSTESLLVLAFVVAVCMLSALAQSALESRHDQAEQEKLSERKDSIQKARHLLRETIKANRHDR